MAVIDYRMGMESSGGNVIQKNLDITILDITIFGP